jgi:signal peptidase I
MTDNQEKSSNSISENKAGSIRKNRRKVPINSVPCHLRLSPQSSALSPMLFSQSSALSPQSCEQKRSSSETLRKRSAPDADRNGLRIDEAKIFPELISDLLTNGLKVKFRAPGYSMYPTILHEDVITVEPIRPEVVQVGDIVLYRNENSVIAHRIIKIENQSSIRIDSQSSVLSTQSFFILRGDARPVCDDPINAEQILGKVVSVERNGRCINPYSLKLRLIFYVRRLASCLKRFLN